MDLASSSTDTTRREKPKSEKEDQGKEPNMCQKIVGYDANALYLWAIMQDMPTGSFTRQREETGFKKESSSKMATEWLEWKAHEGEIFIRHQMNNTEKRIGERKIPVDGFHGPSQTVFQFHGCFWHGHNFHLNKGKEMNEVRKRSKVTANSFLYLVSQYLNTPLLQKCALSLKIRKFLEKILVNLCKPMPRDRTSCPTLEEVSLEVTLGRRFC